MSVKVEPRPVFLGAGLTHIHWGVLDGDEVVAWDTDRGAAHRKADNWMEQKEHRDGA